MEFKKFAKTSERKVFGLDITKSDRNSLCMPPFGSGHQVITSDITVEDRHGNYITFPFYDSIATTEAIYLGRVKVLRGGYNNLSPLQRRNANNGRHMTSSIVEAVYCGLTDALTFANAKNIDDFQEEFGYEKVSECIRAYEGCKKCWEDWSTLVLPEDVEDLWDLANKMQEEYEL